jgi:hypothetical protein
MNSSTKFPYDFVNEFISDSWVLSLTTFVMHISAPIPKFSAPFSYTTVTHNVITIYMTQSTMNLGRALSFCMKKMNHSMYFTAGGSGNDSVHVSSVIIPTLCSENAWGRCSTITNFTCCYWACALALWQRVSFYQPVGGWFWNCPSTVLTSLYYVTL